MCQPDAGADSRRPFCLPWRREIRCSSASSERCLRRLRLGSPLDESAMSAKTPDNYVNTVLLILGVFCGLLLLLIVYGGDLGELMGRTSKGRVQFLMGLGVAAFCAVLAHALVRRWFRACLVASGFFTLAMVAVSLSGGYSPGAFFLISLGVLFLVGFAVAAGIGLVFHLFRTSPNGKQS